VYVSDVTLIVYMIVGLGCTSTSAICKGCSQEQ
jgi:hypothetical protein